MCLKNVEPDSGAASEKPDEEGYYCFNRAKASATLSQNKIVYLLNSRIVLRNFINGYGALEKGDSKNR